MAINLLNSNSFLKVFAHESVKLLTMSLLSKAFYNLERVEIFIELSPPYDQ